MSEEKRRNEYLIYTIESIIDAGNRRVSNLTEIDVYKLLYLAYRRLKSVGIDIELPYSWYIHGTMVESRGFSYHTGGLCLSEYFCDGYAAVNTYNLSSSLQISSEKKSTIDAVVAELLNIYSSGHRIQRELLLKDVYAYAPYDFQREFKFNLFDGDFNLKSRSQIREILDTLKSLYPRGNYPEVYHQYLRWDDTIRLVLGFDIPNQELKQLCKLFWYYFASNLRLQENENLIESELEQATSIEQRQREKLDVVLDETREKYLLLLNEHNRADDEPSFLLNELNKAAYSAFVSER